MRGQSLVLKHLAALAVQMLERFFSSCCAG